MPWYLFAFISAVFSSGAALFQKKALTKDMVLTYAMMLGGLNALLSLPFFFVVDFTKLTVLPLAFVFAATMLGAIAFLLVATAMKNMELSTVAPLLAIGPVITAIFGMLFLGDTLSLVQWGGVICVVIGAYVLEARSHVVLRAPLAAVVKDTSYVRYVLFALVLYAFGALCDRVALGHFNLQPEAYIAFAHIFLAFLFWIIYCSRCDSAEAEQPTPHTTWAIIAVALCTIVYRFSRAEGVHLAPAGLVDSVRTISIFLTTLIGGELFHENNILRKTIASLIMIAGVFFVMQ